MKLKDMTLKELVENDKDNDKGMSIFNEYVVTETILKSWAISKVKELNKQFCKYYPDCDHITCDRRREVIDFIMTNFNLTEEDVK